MKNVVVGAAAMPVFPRPAAGHGPVLAFKIVRFLFQMLGARLMYYQGFTGPDDGLSRRGSPRRRVSFSLMRVLFGAVPEIALHWERVAHVSFAAG